MRHCPQALGFNFAAMVDRGPQSLDSLLLVA
jgi:hypothetical protein